MTATTDHPAVQAIEAQIAHAIQLMDTMDLNPKNPGKKKGNYVPSQYQGPGEPPLRFDQDQGWEVPTEKGMELDQAIRQVGASIEARAMDAHRPTGILTLDRITSIHRSLNNEQESLCKTLASAPEAPEALSEALSCVPCPAVFINEQQYHQHVTATLAHVEALLKQDEATRGGPGRMNHEEFHEYTRHLKLLKHEEACFLPVVEHQTAWAMNEAKLDSEARLEALAEVREMGEQFPDDFITSGELLNRNLAPVQVWPVWPRWPLRRGTENPLSSGDQDVARMVKATGSFFPQDWVDRASKESLEVRLENVLQDRKAADAMASGSWLFPQKIKGGWGRKTPPKITLLSRANPTQGPMTGWESNALHEVGHHFEYVYPEINQIARTHKAIRTMGNDGKLHEVEAIPGFGTSEAAARSAAPDRMDNWGGEGDWCRPGTFASPYTGKETHPWGSEVFSTGIEATIGGRFGALRGHGGNKADPEHTNLILGILATVGRH